MRLWVTVWMFIGLAVSGAGCATTSAEVEMAEAPLEPPKPKPSTRPAAAPSTRPVIKPLVRVAPVIVVKPKPAAPAKPLAEMWEGKGTCNGIASFYAGHFLGRRTANGEIYTGKKLTAAHRVLPFGTQVRVTNLENGLDVIVRINDRGPFIPGRVIDLSPAAAKKLQMTKQGIVRVKMEVVWGREAALN